MAQSTKQALLAALSAAEGGYISGQHLAEALGVSQIYMGFVLTAVRQDRKAKLAAMLGLGDRRICAVMALGMPQFRYPNYIDRAPAPVTRK